MSNLHLNYNIDEDSELFHHILFESQNPQNSKINNIHIIFSFYLVFLMFMIIFIPLYNILLQFLKNDQKQNTLYIIRGVPGIGKRYFAYSMESQITNCDNLFSIINFKDYFFEKGLFKFEGKNLGKAESMVIKNLINCIKNEVSRIYLTGYFEKTWMYSHYKSIAELYGYQVIVIELECQDDNFLKLFNEFLNV